jgi:hypothetical protein
MTCKLIPFFGREKAKVTIPPGTQTDATVLARQGHGPTAQPQFRRQYFSTLRAFTQGKKASRKASQD